MDKITGGGATATAITTMTEGREGWARGSECRYLDVK